MTGDILQRNNVRVLGEGERTMLFAHGFGCDQNIWQFVTPAFERRHRVVLFDYVGSGRSDHGAYDPQRYQSLDGYAQDLSEVCAALQLRDAIYVGHSVSGMIGARAAIRHPEHFRCLAMLAPSPRYLNDKGYFGGFERADVEGLLDLMDQNYHGWANYLAPMVMKNPDAPHFTQLLEESFLATDPVIARQFAATTFFSDSRELLPSLRKPVLVLQCTDDATVPMEVGAYLKAHIRGAKLQVMRATGHYPHVSRPDETVAAIADYVLELDNLARR